MHRVCVSYLIPTDGFVLDEDVHGAQAVADANFHFFQHYDFEHQHLLRWVTQHSATQRSTAHEGGLPGTTQGGRVPPALLERDTREVLSTAHRDCD